MGDFNGDLRDSLGDKGRREPNQRGLKLLDLANYFNMCPVDLINMCAGPLETFNSFCGRYHTTLNYIFVPNCLLSSITSAKAFEADPDNTSDHLPIQLTLTINYNFASCAGNSQRSKKKPKIKWSKFSLEVINTQCVTPLLHDLFNGNIDFSDSGKAVDKISKLIKHHSASLADPSVVVTVKGKTNVMFMSDSLKMLKQLVLTARLHLSLGRITIILMETVLMKIIV